MPPAVMFRVMVTRSSDLSGRCVAPSVGWDVMAQTRLMFAPARQG